MEMLFLDKNAGEITYRCWQKKMDTCDRNMYRNSEKAMFLELLMALYKNNFYILSKNSK